MYVQLQPYRNGDFAEAAMARTRPAPKPAARRRPPKAAGSYTNRALALQAKELAERRKLLEKAVDWCRETGRGARAAEKVGLFPGVTRHMIEAVFRKKNTIVVRDHHCQILTNEERMKLASWLLQCADGHEPKRTDTRSLQRCAQCCASGMHSIRSASTAWIAFL